MSGSRNLEQTKNGTLADNDGIFHQTQAGEAQEGIILESRRQGATGTFPGSDYHGGRGALKAPGAKDPSVLEQGTPLSAPVLPTWALGIKIMSFQ